MKRRQMPYYVFRLKVDDKGRLRLPREVHEALGEQRDVAIMSDARKTIRMYPLGAVISRRTLLGRRPAPAGNASATWGRVALVANRPKGPLELEVPMSCFVTTIDAYGRVIVAPHQGRPQSEVELENEEVYLEWRRDHFFVSTTNPRSFSSAYPDT